jgi:hypothetical protein
LLDGEALKWLDIGYLWPLWPLKKRKNVFQSYGKRGVTPPPLIFAEMSIGLKHKKSVSNLWIGTKYFPLPHLAR